jgi:hypothetical protein
MGIKKKEKRKQSASPVGFLIVDLTLLDVAAFSSY